MKPQSERPPAYLSSQVNLRLDPWVRAQQRYPGISIFLLAASRKLGTVVPIERGDVVVGVGTVKNGLLAVRQHMIGARRPVPGVVPLIESAAHGDSLLVLSKRET
jgi:hypothetical protein